MHTAMQRLCRVLLSAYDTRHQFFWQIALYRVYFVVHMAKPLPCANLTLGKIKWPEWGNDCDDGFDVCLASDTRQRCRHWTALSAVSGWHREPSLSCARANSKSLRCAWVMTHSKLIVKGQILGHLASVVHVTLGKLTWRSDKNITLPSAKCRTLDKEGFCRVLHSGIWHENFCFVSFFIYINSNKATITITYITITTTGIKYTTKCTIDI